DAAHGRAAHVRLAHAALGNAAARTGRGRERRPAAARGGGIGPSGRTARLRPRRLAGRRRRDGRGLAARELCARVQSVRADARAPAGLLGRPGLVDHRCEPARAGRARSRVRERLPRGRAVLPRAGRWARAHAPDPDHAAHERRAARLGRRARARARRLVRRPGGARPPQRGRRARGGRGDPLRRLAAPLARRAARRRRRVRLARRGGGSRTRPRPHAPRALAPAAGPRRRGRKSRASRIMRAVVCAYGEIGAAGLETLLELGCDVALVVTHEDAPGERIWFRSVRDLARAAGVRAIAPANANAPEPLALLGESAPEFLFSFYFRQMLKSPALAVARRGALNLHGSLLPRFRGRAPVNWVLIEGERETGLTLHYMDEKPDHGDVVAQRAVAIGRDDSALTLTRKLAGAARELLRDAIPRLAAGTAARITQDHTQSTYYGGRRPEDGAIDWRAPPERVRNLVRAVTDPWPGAFTWLRGRALTVWWAETAPLDSPRPPGELYLAAGGTPCVAAGDG